MAALYCYSASMVSGNEMILSDNEEYYIQKELNDYVEEDIANDLSRGNLNTLPVRRVTRIWVTVVIS